MPVGREPLSGPCLLQSGLVAGRWKLKLELDEESDELPVGVRRRLDLAEELDDYRSSGRERKQIDCEPPADPCLSQAVGGERRAGADEETAGLRSRSERDEKLDDSEVECWQKRVDYGQPADPHLSLVEGDRQQVRCEEEQNELLAGLR